MKKALIIVDIQNDFVTGTLATDLDESYTHATAEWLNEHKGDYAQIVTTQDWHVEPGDHFDTWPEHCVAFAPGAELHPAIERALSGVTFERFLKGQYSDGYSGFDGGLSVDTTVKLDEYLKFMEIDAVDVIGIATDHCVKATAVDALSNGFKVAVLRDLVNGVDAQVSADLLDYRFEEMGITVE